MHDSIKRFVENVKNDYPEYFTAECSVAELGSLNVNGTVRVYFDAKVYVGCDLIEGEDVDVVCPAHQFPWHVRQKFDCVVSTEMLEHDKNWKKSLYAIPQILRRFGLVILTCAADPRLEHGTRRFDPDSSPATNDYYSNIDPDELRAVLQELGTWSTFHLEYDDIAGDLKFYGVLT